MQPYVDIFQHRYALVLFVGPTSRFVLAIQNAHDEKSYKKTCGECITQWS